MRQSTLHGTSMLNFKILILSYEEVRESLKISNTGKSYGQGNIYLEFLKVIAGNLVEVLYLF